MNRTESVEDDDDGEKNLCALLSAKWYLMVILSPAQATWEGAQMAQISLEYQQRPKRQHSTIIEWQAGNCRPQLSTPCCVLICWQSSYRGIENVWFSAQRLKQQQERKTERKKLKMKNGCRRFAVIIVIFPTISERQVFLQTSRTDLLSSDRSSRFRPNISHVERAEKREFLLDLVHWKLK